MIWRHPDGREVEVHPNAQSTQAILFNGGFRPVVEAPADPAPVVPARPANTLGLGPAVTEALQEAGLWTVDDVRQASDDALLAVRGIGPKTLAAIRQELDD